jgi:hypothetical protein
LATEEHPTCKVLLAIVWLRDNIYTAPFLSVNGPVEVAIISNVKS